MKKDLFWEGVFKKRERSSGGSRECTRIAVGPGFKFLERKRWRFCLNRQNQDRKRKGNPVDPQQRETDFLRLERRNKSDCFLLSQRCTNGKVKFRECASNSV
mmetsp:Transcript_25055/g.34591  ORF Transcript_25055/g.34591 Transcript_25055/m.34591 type:complete len:102 (+) Transcript_25055:1-306(+)